MDDRHQAGETLLNELGSLRALIEQWLVEAEKLAPPSASAPGPAPREVPVPPRRAPGDTGPPTLRVTPPANTDRLRDLARRLDERSRREPTPARPNRTGPAESSAAHDRVDAHEEPA